MAKDFIPNIDKAKKQNHYWWYSEYSSAYIIANEDLRASMRYVPQNCNRALTVAGSGDNPLFCSLYGAKHVDTFDISYNAKCIMDIKTAAIGKLNLSDYLNLLEHLHATHDVATVPNMDKISKKLSATEYNYMCAMSGSRLFNFCNVYDKHDSNLLNSQEYQKLQKIVKNRYKFYWTDIRNLNNYLVEQYDFMHLSNVLESIGDRQFHIMLLEQFVRHVNVGGRILIQHLRFDPWDYEYFSNISAADAFLKKCRFIQAPNDISIFERIR